MESDRVRQKLLSLIGRIGREARSETTTGKVCGHILQGLQYDACSVFGVTVSVWRLPVQVLEVLWELAHLPTLPTTLVQQALEEHLGILSDAYAVKETVKRSYIIKCIEDIKKVRHNDWRCVLMPSFHLAPSYMLSFYLLLSS